MKQLSILTFFFLSAHFTFGQACGIYRIKYAGNFAPTNKEIVKVHLPTKMFLHGLEEERSNLAFVATTLTNGLFQIQISSHLTTPYSDIDQLLSYYKKQSDKFRMKISYWEHGSLKEAKIEIAWDKIEVSVINDGKFGTLFEFRYKDISL